MNNLCYGRGAAHMAVAMMTGVWSGGSGAASLGSGVTNAIAKTDTAKSNIVHVAGANATAD